MVAKNKLYRDAVKKRMDALAVVAERAGMKNQADTWEIRPGSPTHNQDWKLLAWSFGQPIEVPFLLKGHLGWSAKEAATALDHCGRVMNAMREMYGIDRV